MKEKIIITSESYSPSRIRTYIYGIPVGCIVLGVVLYLLNFDRSRGPNYWGEYWTILDNMVDPFSFVPGLMIDLGLILLIISIIIGVWLKSHSLTVTDRRVFGITSWGKRVDLPIDSISAVASTKFKGIVVSTSSGRIAFNLIKNREEIYNAISSLIIERQNNITSSSKTAINQENSQSIVDELKGFKELLDMGIITQEEFDAKRKQLLGVE